MNFRRHRGSTLAEVGGMILDIVLALVISLYLLVDGYRFRERSLALVTAAPPRRCSCKTMSPACWVSHIARP